MKKFRIKNREIGAGEPAFIIAEAGINHLGNIDIAKELVRVAKKCGADAIKFQAFSAEKMLSEKNEAFEIFEKQEFSEDEWREVKKASDDLGIIFLSSVFDFEHLTFLDKIGMDAFKIASGDLTYYPLLKKTAKLMKPIILSTGMSIMKEVQEASELIYKQGNEKLVLLHCVSTYPTAMEEVNLRSLQALRDNFDVPVGLSDHTFGIHIPVAAVALGARVVEKHFTLSRRLLGPDQSFSLIPSELKEMIEKIRDVEKALGNRDKKPTREEASNKELFRRSIFAARTIKIGEEITEDMLICKRPAKGISPVYWDELLGKKAKTRIEKGCTLTWGMLF